MALKAGTYNLNANSGKLFVYTFKEGFLSAIAHDPLIDVTNFTIYQKDYCIEIFILFKRVIIRCMA